MSEHYYSARPEVASNPGMIEAVLLNRTLRFNTDAGVFSKQQIDFGSRLLIESVQLEAHEKVLDVGCGYGPIGLFAATQLPQGIVTLVDINERAVELCRKNAAINQLHNVKILHSDLFEQLQGKQFDKILSNPPIRTGKQTVHRIFAEAFRHLHEGGSLWVVMQKKQGAPSAFAKLQEIFPHVVEIAKSKGYRIMKATK